MRDDAINAYLKRLGTKGLGANGKWIVAACPFAPYTHKNGVDNNPSFVVSDDTPSIYTCLTCKHKGRFFDLPAQLAGLTKDTEKRSQLIMLCEEMKSTEDDAFFIDLIEEDNTEHPEYEFDEHIFKIIFKDIHFSPTAVQYCMSRGLSEDTLIKLELRYDPKYKRVVFPIRDEKGILRGWAGRAIEHGVTPKVFNDKGMQKNKVILGACHWRPKRDVIVTEGLFGYARLMELGLHDTYNCAAILGSSMSNYQAAMIMAYSKQALLLFDDDEAGHIGLYDEKNGALKKLNNIIAITPEYPAGRNDVDLLSRDDIEKMFKKTPSDLEMLFD